MVTSITIIDRGRYEDASSSQERKEMRSEIKIRTLRAELKEAKQSRNDELAKEAKYRGAG